MKYRNKYFILLGLGFIMSIIGASTIPTGEITIKRQIGSILLVFGWGLFSATFGYDAATEKYEKTIYEIVDKYGEVKK